MGISFLGVRLDRYLETLEGSINSWKSQASKIPWLVYVGSPRRVVG